MGESYLSRIATSSTSPTQRVGMMVVMMAVLNDPREHTCYHNTSTRLFKAVVCFAVLLLRGTLVPRH